VQRRADLEKAHELAPGLAARLGHLGKSRVLAHEQVGRAAGDGARDTGPEGLEHVLGLVLALVQPGAAADLREEALGEGGMSWLEGRRSVANSP